MLIHAEEKPYGKSIHTGEEPHTYDFIIVRINEKPVYKSSPCQIYWLKLTIFYSQKLLATKYLLM